VIVKGVLDEVNVRHILCSFILFSLFICQIGVSSNFQSDTIVSDQTFSVSDNAVFRSVIVGTPFSEVINVTTDRLLIQYDVEKPSVVSFNFSLEGISAISGVGFGIEALESEKQYIPQLDEYSYGTRQFYTTSAFLSTGLILSGEQVRYASEPGFVMFDFVPTWSESSDLVRINLTVIEHHVLADATDIEIGENANTHWTIDDSWNSLHFSLTDDGLYNVSMSSYFDYETLGGWSGATVSLMAGVLIDIQHGRTYPWDTFSVGFYLDPGADVGTKHWTTHEVMSLPQGEYYLIVGAKQFEHLGEFNLTLNVENVDTISLSPNEQLELEFGDDGINQFILEISPEYYYLNDLSFDITNGANWSVKALNWLTTKAVFSAENYENTLLNYVNEIRYTDFIILDSLIGHQDDYSSPALTGDSYRDEVITYGHYIQDNNGSTQLTSVSTTIKNKFPKFYFTVIAEPLDSYHSESFNATLNFDSQPIPDISEGVTTLDFDLTLGPSNYFYKVPVESGTIIDATITPTGYGSLGAVFLQIYPDVQTKNNWQIVFEPYLTWGDSIQTYPFRVGALNDAATLRVMAVADGYMILNPYSYSSYPSDLTEAELDIKIIDPVDYEVGESVSAELTSETLLAYEFNVVEGIQYRFEIELSGIEASSIFFNSEGYSPFQLTGLDPWVNVNPSSSMKQTVLYTANENTTAILAIVGAGSVEFTIDANIWSNNTMVNNTVYTDLNTTEYNQGYSDGMVFGMLIAGGGVVGLMVLIMILRRR